ncbi:hypothetical protein N7520_007126 [Penicillium odoratum]|uniref:uncharacterized protein n=1 Tax=Penicillium odoratum TaxID=1167516 RepID=UPI00254828A3|nr:uncharacterized protein N7520_007126 [Penicillium odoratum]KAJ5759970.1 hypothetical protein N7520_007126 [Penicillium odoratum]
MHLAALLTVGAVPAMGAALARRAGLSVENLQQLNPGITCPNLDSSKSYCVVGTATDDPPSTTSTTKTTTSATPTEVTPSNSPTMPGIAENCDGFHEVLSGDQCNTIATQYDWNLIYLDCTNLWLDYYVCVHVPGATTTSQAPEPTASGPTPQMPGIVSNCKTYHLIRDGDSCWSIDTAAGITLAQFRTWNAQIDATCSNLWLGYYVCVGV